MSRSEVRDIIQDALKQRTDSLDARALQVVEESLIRIIEILDNEHNIVFIRGSLRRATRSSLTTMLNGENI